MGQSVINTSRSANGEGSSVIRKTVLWLPPVFLGALIASQWRDIIRYVKIKQMSLGQGHPQYVPAEGSTAYPQDSASSTPDGTGEFDSARRGGPAAQ
jgi:hypothetical protein